MWKRSRTAAAGSKIMAEKGNRPVPIDTVELVDEERVSTGIGEFDRVLGGGLVAGTLVLIGGDPGIGKSTLMLQALHGLASSGQQGALCFRGGVRAAAAPAQPAAGNRCRPDMLVVSEIDLDAILAMVATDKPDVLVIDSIQTMYSPEI